LLELAVHDERAVSREPLGQRATGELVGLVRMTEQELAGRVGMPAPIRAELAAADARGFARTILHRRIRDAVRKAEVLDAVRQRGGMVGVVEQLGLRPHLHAERLDSLVERGSALRVDRQPEVRTAALPDRIELAWLVAEQGCASQHPFAKRERKLREDRRAQAERIEAAVAQREVQCGVRLRAPRPGQRGLELTTQLLEQRASCEWILDAGE
jgi:hypothetical protein